MHPNLLLPQRTFAEVANVAQALVCKALVIVQIVVIAMALRYHFHAPMVKSSKQATTGNKEWNVCNYHMPRCHLGRYFLKTSVALHQKRTSSGRSILHPPADEL